MPRSNRRNQDIASLKPWHWFVLAAAVPIIHCAKRLNLDLWHDEIYTVDVFLRGGPAFIVSDYHLANNHVLFSLIEWPFYCLSESNFILRLPSFLCALGTLAVVFRLALRLGGLTCAVLSTALLGLNQMFLIFAIQVRGYSLSMFLAACLASFASSSAIEASWRRFTAIVSIGAAFLYVLPTNAIFFVPIGAIAIGRAVVRQPRRQSVVEATAWAAAALLALFCYLPILEQIREASASSSPSSWSYLPVVAANFFRPATHDFVWFAPAVLLGLIAWAWPQPANRPPNPVPVLCGGVTGGAFLLTGLLRISPFERVYCPLLIFLALAGGWLLAEFTEAVRLRLARFTSAQAGAAVALAAVSIPIWPQLWDYPRRLEQRRDEFNATHERPRGDGWPIADGYYCYYAANYRPSAIVNHLIDERIEQFGYRVCWTKTDHWNLWHYFAERGLSASQLPPSGEGRVATYAILPEPPPWDSLAKECELTDEELKSFQLVGDFGYYRLYRQSQGVSSDQN